MTAKRTLLISLDTSPHRNSKDWEGVEEAILDSDILTDGIQLDLNYANRELKIPILAKSPAAQKIMSVHFTGA